VQKPNAIQQLFEKAFLALPRRRLRRAAKEKLAAAASAMVAVNDTRKKLQKYRMADVLCLYDAGLFCIMFDADLTVLARDMSCTSDWWQSRLYGRLLAMTLVECVEDIPTVLGKKFRESLRAVIADDSRRQRISAITKGLSEFGRRNDAELRYVRRAVAAHRDHNVNLQVEVIDKLDLKKLTSLASELNDLLGALSRTMADIFMNIDIVRETLKSFVKQPWGMTRCLVRKAQLADAQSGRPLMQALPQCLVKIV
jgi:hypothetical protein